VLFGVAVAVGEVVVVVVGDTLLLATVEPFLVGCSVWLNTSVRVPVDAVVARVMVAVGEKYVAPEGMISPLSETEPLRVKIMDVLLNGSLTVTRVPVWEP
jgi:hypothetical protein